jgi:hypothetical protein
MDDPVFTDWLGERCLATSDLDHMMSLMSEESTPLFDSHGQDLHPSLRWLPNMDTLHTNISAEPVAGPDLAMQYQNTDMTTFTETGIDNSGFQFKGSTGRSSVMVRLVVIG